MDYTIFVKSYKNSKDKEGFVKKHITKNYLGYVDKMTIAKNVARYSSHVISEDGTVGIYKRDTMMQYFLTQMDIISKFTDIEFPSDLMTEAYDALAECGALNELFRFMPESEVKMINSMVQMAMDDTYINEQDLSVILTNKFDAIGLMLDETLNTLQTISTNTNNPIAKLTEIK